MDTYPAKPKTPNTKPQTEKLSTSCCVLSTFYDVAAVEPWGNPNLGFGVGGSLAFAGLAPALLLMSRPALGWAAEDLEASVWCVV